MCSAAMVIDHKEQLPNMEYEHQSDDMEGYACGYGLRKQG